MRYQNELVLVLRSYLLKLFMPQIESKPNQIFKECAPELALTQIKMEFVQIWEITFK